MKVTDLSAGEFIHLVFAEPHPMKWLKMMKRCSVIHVIAFKAEAATGGVL